MFVLVIFTWLASHWVYLRASSQETCLPVILRKTHFNRIYRLQTNMRSENRSVWAKIGYGLGGWIRNRLKLVMGWVVGSRSQSQSHNYFHSKTFENLSKSGTETDILHYSYSCKRPSLQETTSKYEVHILIFSLICTIFLI